MKFMLCAWDAYMQDDFIEWLQKLGHVVRPIGYCFDDIDYDDYFMRNFRKLLDKSYDGMITLNYYPIVARLCYEKGIPYLAWVYDSPFDVKQPEKTLGLPTNHVFFFDAEECNKYRKKGFQTVYHLELAVNTARLDKMALTVQDNITYAADISFVGNMYHSLFSTVYHQLGGYEQGYVSSVMDVQLPFYGACLLEQVLPDNKLIPWRKYFSDVAMITEETEEVFCNWFRHTVAAEITRRERILLLRMLSKRHKVALYSSSKEPMLGEVDFRGTVGSFEEAPKVYRQSRINMNISYRQIKTGIPLRVLDILGAGGFLLTNYQAEIADNFTDGHDLVIYESIEDAVKKAEYYLTHEEERKEIARNGRRAVERFSFEKQIPKMLCCVYGN